MRIRIYSFILLAGLAMQGCYTPAHIVKLVPEREADKWFYGQALLCDSVDGISYEVGFDLTNNGQYLFDFHIRNRSNLPILIDPANYCYTPLDSAMHALGNTSPPALDPETQLLEIDRELSVNEARSKNQLGISLMAIGADVATGVILATDDNPRNDYIAEPVSGAIQASVFASGAANEFETRNLNELREAWENSAIRKTTLECNYSMHGKVFFPACPEAAYIRLHIPVDEKWM
ncbi:MAG: hypothetical protein AB7D05_08840, partial [Mangrovibacterium sp.]